MTALSFLYLLVSWLLGILSACLIPFSLPAWPRIFIGPALGMIIAAQLTFFLALILPYDSNLIWTGVLLPALPIAILWMKNAFLTRRDFQFTKTFLQSWPGFVISLTIGSVVLYLYCARILAPGPYGLIISQGGLYGDTAFHSAQITSFAVQGVPISNPLYAGVPFRYPFLINFYAACLIKLGMSLRLALVLPQIMNFAAFLTLFQLVAKKFTNPIGTLFGFLMMLLGWGGLGFVNYIHDSLTSGTWKVSTEYTNDGRLLRMHNFIGLALPQRGLLSGLILGLLLTVCFLYHEGVLQRKHGLWLGLFLGILPLWHVHSFLFMGLSLFVWFSFRYLKNWRENIDGILTFSSVAIALSLPIMLWYGQQLSPRLRLEMGWTQPDQNILLFWLRNTGFMIPLALLSLIHVMKSNRYVFLPALIVFFLANIVVFQPWDWDNIKLLVWVFLFVSIPACSYLAWLFSRGAGFKVLTIFLLFTLTASGSLSLLRLLSKEYVFTIYDRYDLELANWAMKSTDPASVFLVSDVPAHPISGLTGRSVYLGYPGYVWVHGIDYRPRMALERRVLRGDLSALKELEMPVEYIVAERTQPLFEHHDGLALCYSNYKYTVFRLH